jgi:hypothetical protein
LKIALPAEACATAKALGGTRSAKAGRIENACPTGMGGENGKLLAGFVLLHTLIEN